MQTIKLGLVGCGVVGSGVYALLSRNADLISKRIGAKLQIAMIADRSLKNVRKLRLPKSIRAVKDWRAVVTDPEVQIVVELIGGKTTAFEVVEAALLADKHVVTANKALLAERGESLFLLAEQKNLQLLFEAAIGGTIPIVHAIRSDFAGEQIEQIYGILNGTCNYILTELTKGGADFATVLSEAQKKRFCRGGSDNRCGRD